MYKLIACNVFLREVCWCVARSPQAIDVEFTELGEHVHSGKLRETIQAKIDAAESSGKSYEAILLLFGLCGNAGVGLCARKTQLVIPRAHDCCTILLGSKAKFLEHFQNCPSTPFGSSGYLERGDYFLRTHDGENKVHYGDVYASYVEQYGEENARYIWETLHPPAPEGSEKNRAVFIDIPEISHLGYAERFKRKAEEAGKEYIRLEGSLRLIRNLTFGQWDAEDFLIVRPGQKTAGVYDWSEIIRAKDQP